MFSASAVPVGGVSMRFDGRSLGQNRFSCCLDGSRYSGALLLADHGIRPPTESMCLALQGGRDAGSMPRETGYDSRARGKVLFIGAISVRFDAWARSGWLDPSVLAPGIGGCFGSPRDGDLTCIGCGQIVAAWCTLSFRQGHPAIMIPGRDVVLPRAIGIKCLRRCCSGRQPFVESGRQGWSSPWGRGLIEPPADPILASDARSRGPAGRMMTRGAAFCLHPPPGKAVATESIEGRAACDGEDQTEPGHAIAIARGRSQGTRDARPRRHSRDPPGGARSLPHGSGRDDGSAVHDERPAQGISGH